MTVKVIKNVINEYESNLDLKLWNFMESLNRNSFDPSQLISKEENFELKQIREYLQTFAYLILSVLGFQIEHLAKRNQLINNKFYSTKVVIHDDLQNIGTPNKFIILSETNEEIAILHEKNLITTKDYVVYIGDVKKDHIDFLNSIGTHYLYFKIDDLLGIIREELSINELIQNRYEEIMSWKLNNPSSKELQVNLFVQKLKSILNS